MDTNEVNEEGLRELTMHLGRLTALRERVLNAAAEHSSGHRSPIVMRSSSLPELRRAHVGTGHRGVAQAVQGADAAGCAPPYGMGAW